MDIAELKELLRTNIRDNAYILGPPGPRASDVWVLEQQAVEGQWSAYYAERGKRQQERIFATEHEACAFLLDVLLRDPGARRQPSDAEDKATMQKLVTRKW